MDWNTALPVGFVPLPDPPQPAIVSPHVTAAINNFECVFTATSLSPNAPNSKTAYFVGPTFPSWVNFVHVSPATRLRFWIICDSASVL